MSDPNWLKLCVKLGGKCNECNTTDPDIWEIHHIDENGYLEREWFRVNKINSWKYYLDHFDEEKQYLQVLCRNCHKKISIKNRENKSNVRFTDFPEFTLPLNSDNIHRIAKILENNSVLWQTFSRQLRMLVDVTELSGKLRENQISIKSSITDFQELATFEEFFKLRSTEHYLKYVTKEEIDDLLKTYGLGAWLIDEIHWSGDGDEREVARDYHVIPDGCYEGIPIFTFHEKFGKRKTNKYLELMLSEGIIYESAAGKYKLV